MMKTLWWKRLELALSSAFTECWTGAKWMPAIPNIHYMQLLHTNPWISIKTYLFLLHYMFATFLTLSLKWLILGFATFKKYPWSYFISLWIYLFKKYNDDNRMLCLSVALYLLQPYFPPKTNSATSVPLRTLNYLCP